MNRKKKIFSGKFILGLILYAVLFLALVGLGLSFLWKYMEAYELSRPKNTITEFIEQLTPDQICAASGDLYETLDGFQSRADFDTVIKDMLASGELNYAKKSSESTEDRQVYVLRSGRTVIGSFTIEAGAEDKYGFRRWQVTDSSYDFSFLLGEPFTITVPSEYEVTVDQVLLDESYLVETGIRYSALEEFYDDYALPTMVTYAVNRYVGDVDVKVLDGADIVEITSDMDMNTLLPRCSEEQTRQITEFTENFVDLWVKFSGSTNATKGANYNRLKKILSSDGALKERLYSALDGLTFGQSNGSKIMSITVNRIVPIADGTYMCDMTYVVSTTGRQGAVETESSMKLIIVTEDGNLRLKAMERY